ncbi:RuvC family protein [Paenirhodobacter populi]|uniref:hypothetical protein n=1 Tax=Paenirhodobacter populi TaxID=2306993 RepID=UPI000FE33BFC|nr:hypothetical protein [Sinirhodobacter populi]RWR04145.1 hypothetical protein D2T32_20590 [Sinirhodobacter populi]
MTRIPFALFPFPDPDLSADVIERRLRQHLVRLIAPKIGIPLNADGTIDKAGHEVMLESIDLPYAKTRRLRERAERIVERRKEKSSMSRMKTEDRKRIMPLRDGVELIGIPNEHRADELAAALLPLLEPLSARNRTCPYFELPFDMGWIIWVRTSNNWRRLPDPLLSRCPTIRLEPLTLMHLLGFAAHEGERRGLSPEAIDAIRAALEWAEAVSKFGGGVCRRVIFRAARHSDVRSSFRAGGGPISLARRSAAPKVGQLSPDQAGMACIRRRIPIRETIRLML